MLLPGEERRAIGVYSSSGGPRLACPRSVKKLFRAGRNILGDDRREIGVYSSGRGPRFACRRSGQEAIQGRSLYTGRRKA